MIIHQQTVPNREADALFINEFIRKSKMAKILSPAIVAMVLYTEVEGGPWEPYYSMFCSERELKRICEAYARPNEEPTNRVLLPGNIKACAVLFHDGVIWDAILSGYDTKRRRGLPKCYPKRY